MEPAKVIKIGVLIAVLLLIGWGIFHGIGSIFRDLEESHPHPTDPADTTKDFFYCLEKQDYQECYVLLVLGRKVATAINKQSKENYFDHFDRIREYLEERVGEKFYDTMKVSSDGQKATFNNGIVLTLEFDSATGFDDKLHYGVRQINEFPIDMAPGIGLEKHYRQVDKAIESLDAPGSGGEEIDSPSEIIRDQPGESKRQRQKRMIKAFKNARQLDTRHIVLEEIIRESSRDSLPYRFLEELENNEKEPLQLRKLSEKALDQAHQGSLSSKATLPVVYLGFCVNVYFPARCI